MSDDKTGWQIHDANKPTCYECGGIVRGGYWWAEDLPAIFCCVDCARRWAKRCAAHRGSEG